MDYVSKVEKHQIKHQIKMTKMWKLIWIINGIIMKCLSTPIIMCILLSALVEMLPIFNEMKSDSISLVSNIVLQLFSKFYILILVLLKF